MTKEDTDKFTDDKLSNADSEKDSSSSFFNRLKKQVTTFTSNINKNDSTNEKNVSGQNNVVSEDEIKRKEQEAKSRASKLENERKKFEREQQKIEEEHKKNLAELAEQERLERERIARERELERQRIEREKAEKREQERLERERIARERELERQRIEREKAEKREQERLERERIAREKELERQRIEREKAEKREQERLERERIAREKEEERKRIEAEQAEQRRREFHQKDKEFKLSSDKRKVEFLEKENEKREHENTLLSLQTSLIVINDKIAEKKLKISKLKNRNVPKEEIALEEKRLRTILSQKQATLKKIATEKKIIEKIQKNLELDHKLEDFKKEIYNIKKEVVNAEETVFNVKYNNKLRNIFAVSIIYMRAFISRHIFRKKDENYPEIKRASKNIKVRIVTSFILALILSIFFLIMLKFISTAKEHYVSFDDLQTTAVDTTDEMKKQKEAEEKARIKEEQEKADAARIDSAAQDEEITAKLGGTFVSYSFNIDREVTTSKKIHAFNSANWSDVGDVIEAGTKFTVNKLVSPAGYMMYQIASGPHAGQFISANENFVTVDSKNDQFSGFVSNPIAIKFSATQNVYNDEALSSVKMTAASGATLNISGYGISKNNRLIYHITDGSFVAVNPVSLTEVNRASSNSKNINNDSSNSNSSNNQRNSTTQNTTQSSRSSNNG